MILRQVISGGQIGVDQVALEVAKSCGISTGGLAPKGYLTINGPMPELLKSYGLEENSSKHYNKRTYHNVFKSDATLCIAHNFKSFGELCTLNAIKIYNKPYKKVLIRADRDFSLSIEEVAAWIINNGIEILNVAGNRPYKNAKLDIIDNTRYFLYNLFSMLQKPELYSKLERLLQVNRHVPKTDPSFDICEVCGTRYSIRCNCDRKDSTCPKGHSWHLCLIHKRRVLGWSDHSKDPAICTCPK